MELRHKITPEELEHLGWKYIKECINNKKEQATASGKIVLIKQRHLPTIAYFLRVWLPLKGKPTLSRSTYYNWLNSGDDKLMDIIKNVEQFFNAVAIDIVANEGTGIFYAKNKLGMTDRVQQENINSNNFNEIIITRNINDTSNPHYQLCATNEIL